MQAADDLFGPALIEAVDFRNKVVCAPHWTGFNTGASYGERYLAYLEARAAGGAGWVITEPMSSHPASRSELEPGRAAWQDGDPDLLPSWRELTRRIHRHGARVSMTVGHAGRNSSWLDTGRAALAASDDPAVISREVPAPATAEDVAAITANLRIIAARAAASGFDGLELQCTADYFMGSFLSPLINTRDDEYGGDLDSRLRVIDEALHALRDGAQNAVLVGMRISADHLVPGGLGVDDTAEICARLAERGRLDYVSVIVGSYYALEGITPTMGAPIGTAVDAGRAVRSASRLPTVVAGRIPDATTAERILGSGSADFIAFARPFIADPAWVTKVADGRSAEVNRCLYCNQQCVTRLSQKQPISCVQNPAAGRERYLEPRPRADRRRIVVVGGGPGGLEAACTAARLGHETVLLERSDELGGQVKLAAAMPGRSEWRHAIDPRVARLRTDDADIRLGTEADLRLLTELAPDAVIQATGAIPWQRPGYRSAQGPLEIEGLAATEAWTFEAACADPPEKRRVLVVDELGRRASVSLIELLLDRGCEIDVVTSFPQLGYPALALSQELARLIPPLLRRGVAVHPFSRLSSVAGGGAHVTSSLSGEVTTLPSVDVVILAMLGTSTPELPVPAGVVRRAVGDAVAPRDAGAALLDGRRTVLDLDSQWRAATLTAPQPADNIQK